MTGGQEDLGCSAALRYCKDNYQWLRDSCIRAVRVRRSTNFISDGEDLAQTVCKVCGDISDERWAEVEERERYILTVVRNEANRGYRKRMGEPVVSPDDLDEPPTGPHAEPYFAALYLKQLLSTLPEDRRRLLEMAYVEDLSGEEMATVLGLPPETVRKRLSRLRQKLKDLNSEGDTVCQPPG